MGSLALIGHEQGDLKPANVGNCQPWCHSSNGYLLITALNVAYYIFLILMGMRELVSIQVSSPGWICAVDFNSPLAARGWRWWRSLLFQPILRSIWTNLQKNLTKPYWTPLPIDAITCCKSRTHSHIRDIQFILKKWHYTFIILRLSFWVIALLNFIVIFVHSIL